MIPVRFEYTSGLLTDTFQNARLVGSWDGWSDHVPMTPFHDTTGVPAFSAVVELPDTLIETEIQWGVYVDGPGGVGQWGIATEVQDRANRERHRSFRLRVGDDAVQRYSLSTSRALGANKHYTGDDTEPGIRFAVWAPNARQVSLVLGDRASGYIWDPHHDDIADRGERGSFPMFETSKGPDWDGIWETRADIQAYPDGFIATPDMPEPPTLQQFATFDHIPYMLRIVREDGSVKFRTDLYSRCQIGSGDRNNAFDPEAGNEPPWTGKRQDLDGTISCSVVVDPETVTTEFAEVDEAGDRVWPERNWNSQEEFWREEFVAGKELPTRVEDLIIYELHVGALGFGKQGPGTLEDALELLDTHLVPLGINCIELLPLSEFRGGSRWGYSSSHFFAIEFTGGGRDQFKHFIRACHQRGISVILDVVYNHYHHYPERAEQLYDTNTPAHDIYFWQEPQDGDLGPYLQNDSSGRAPRYWEEQVRNMFVSSALALLDEFHIDGFRVDQTTSMREYNHLERRVGSAPWRAVPDANAFGAKFLREWMRAVRLVRPHVITMAEDHSSQNPGAIVRPVDHTDDGFGFDATWYSDFYHHLIGDTRWGRKHPSHANLIRSAAALRRGEALAMNWFAAALEHTQNHTVVYAECHDEAGNSENETSMRTVVAGVNGAALTPASRPHGEARARFATSMALFAAGTPLIFMGDEVAASKPYRYADFRHLQEQEDPREDLAGLRNGKGSRMYLFYQQAIKLRRDQAALRDRHIEIVCTDNTSRVIAFIRRTEDSMFFIAGSLADTSFDNGYSFFHPAIPAGQWREVLTSDDTVFEGSGVSNGNTPVSSETGHINMRIPANGVIVLERQNEA